MNRAKEQFSIWTYIASILLIYGLLLTAGGIYQLWHPPATALANYHASLVAGILLLAIGGSYFGLKRKERGSR